MDIKSVTNKALELSQNAQHRLENHLPLNKKSLLTLMDVVGLKTIHFLNQLNCSILHDEFFINAKSADSIAGSDCLDGDSWGIK